jgi:hypothetical protein
MNTRIKQLRDLVVSLDLSDRNLEKLAPDRYQDAAKTALLLTREEMGLLPIADFAGPVSALQTMAENIYFGVHGCFADLDASGRAGAARMAAKGFFDRMKPASPGVAAEIADRLFARIRTRSAA